MTDLLDLGLSVKTNWSLRQNWGVTTIEQLRHLSDKALLRIGKKTLGEVKDALQRWDDAHGQPVETGDNPPPKRQRKR